MKVARQYLLKLTDADYTWHIDFPTVRFHLAGDQTKHRCFTGTVPPDKTDPLARINHKVCLA